MTTLPFDRDAERAVLGSSILAARYHDQARAILEPADFWLPEHARLFAALDELPDTSATSSEPSVDRPVQSTLRAAALAVMCDLPIIAVRGLVLCCGDVPSNAARVRARAERRAEILEAQARVDELVGAAW